MVAADEVHRRVAQVRQGVAAGLQGFALEVDYVRRLAKVDSGGVVRYMRYTGVAPFVGGRVQVRKLGQQWECSPAGEGSPEGTVATVSGTDAVILGDDEVTYTYRIPVGLSLSSGNRVAMDHTRRMVMVQMPELPSEVRVPSTPSPAPVTQETRTFRPVNSGNWYASGGRWDTQYAEISITRSGYYFYGTQIRDTIPDSATILNAYVDLRELADNVPGTPSQMGVHGYSQRPASGPLPLTGAVPVTGTNSWSITQAMADMLKVGSAFGIGFAQNTGWRRFDTYVQSGAITITWQL